MNNLNKDINILKNSSIHKKLQKYIKTLEFFDDSFDDYIYIYDLTSERVFFTDKIREKFPIPSAEENGNPFDDWYNIVYPKDRKLMDHYRELLVKEEIQSFDIRYRIMDKKNNKVWVRVKGALRKKDDKQSLLIVGHISEMTTSGKIDNLTGLCGIGKFMEDIKQDIKENDGYLMIIDVDNLKMINLAQGRSYGDSILKKLADILDSLTDYPIALYRLDGNRFAVNFIDGNLEDIEQLYSIAKKDMEGICTLSAGVASYNHKDSIDSGTIYLYAENALFQAKKEGKNRIIFFSVDVFEKDVEKGELIEEMNTCIQDNFRGFSLEYQPQIDSNDLNLYGVEALLRYESVSRGKVNPEKFITLLEESNLICSVGKWTLKTAVYQCKKWRKYIPNLHISVNISYVQLKQEDIADEVLNILKEANLPGSALTLEITENIQLQNYEYFNKIFYIWKQNDIKISIDDFGTGYSSLSYLKNIEIDEVKIDRCFVDHVQYDAYNYHLIKNMIELAHSAKIEVCCEGVESNEELNVLLKLQTNRLQGFLFSKPCSVDRFEETYICKSSQIYQERENKWKNFKKLEIKNEEELVHELKKEEIENIIESMDEVIYVCDIDTYELYYLNTAGKRMTGIYDYAGNKCYKVLQGRDEPCEFCTNDHLSTDKFFVWELDNIFLEKRFILKDKLIPWKGKLARVEMAIDITEREILSQSIKKRLDIKQMIIDTCKVLFAESDKDKYIEQILAVIGEFSECEGVYILEQNCNNDKWNIKWQWHIDKKITSKNSCKISYEYCSIKNSSKRLTMPIIWNNDMVGLIYVDKPHYVEETESLLNSIVDFLGYAMCKNKI